MILYVKSQTTLDDGTVAVVVGDKSDPDFEAYLTREQYDNEIAPSHSPSHAKARELEDANGPDWVMRVDVAFKDAADRSQGQGESHQESERSQD